MENGDQQQLSYGLRHRRIEASNDLVLIYIYKYIFILTYFVLVP